MSTRRIAAKAGWVFDASKLPRGPDGRALCRQCGEEVPVGRRTFCGDKCVDDWKIATDPGHVRKLVLGRDHGICARCGRDCEALKRRIRDYLDRGHYVGDEAARHRHYLAAHRLHGWLSRFGLRCHGRGYTFWEAHHKVAVVEGGGECGLEGYESVCVCCHRRETRALAKRRAEQRRAAKAAASPQGNLPLGPGRAP